MRVLWVNPSFLDYRIPLYAKLNELLEGNFHLIYSKERIPLRCHNKVKEAIGENANPIEKEVRLRIGNQGEELANKSISIPFPKGLYGKIKYTKPDVIIAEGFFQFTPWAVAYSFFHHKPLYIAYERTAHTERNCPLWRRMYRKFINLFVKGYIANGILTKEYLISQGVDADKIYTGGMCADSEGLSNAVKSLTTEEIVDFKASILGSRSGGMTYIAVGKMIERKGVNYLLDAWQEHSKRYPDDNILLVGNGPLYDEYKSKYGALPSVFFMGGIDYSQIYKYYAISDVFVIATLEDNWSLVVPEAMACGLPVACSIYNGCYPELVRKDENGITFDTMRQDTILDAFEYFHKVNLAEFGSRSIMIESDFSPAKIANNIIIMTNETVK